MSTSTSGSVTPQLPLSADARAAYQALYDKAQTAIENTTDVDLLTSLNTTRANIGAVISADNQCQLGNDTTLFQDLLAKINGTNKELNTLQQSIARVEGGIAKFGEVLSAINAVRSLVSL